MSNVTNQQIERFLDALDLIAECMERRLQLDYPPKKEPTDATITHIPNQQDRLKESLSGEDAESSIEEWLGPREKAYLSEGDQEESGGDEEAGSN